MKKNHVCLKRKVKLSVGILLNLTCSHCGRCMGKLILFSRDGMCFVNMRLEVQSLQLRDSAGFIVGVWLNVGTGVLGIKNCMGDFRKVCLGVCSGMPQPNKLTFVLIVFSVTKATIIRRFSCNTLVLLPERRKDLFIGRFSYFHWWISVSCTRLLDLRDRLRRSLPPGRPLLQPALPAKLQPVRQCDLSQLPLRTRKSSGPLV